MAVGMNSKMAKDGSTAQPCPVCLGLFEDEIKFRIGDLSKFLAKKAITKK